MKKAIISKYCKNIRLDTKLSIEQFATRQTCSRQYISKVENGHLDKNYSVANIEKLIKVYDLNLNDLQNINIDDKVVEALMHKQSTNAYDIRKNNEMYCQILKDYLKQNGYTKFKTNSKLYDLVAVNKKNNKTICEIILPFSTGVSRNKRDDLLLKRFDSFYKKILVNEKFNDDKPVELIIFTTSKKNYDALLDFKKKHFKNASARFMSLKVLYIYNDIVKKEFIIKEKR